MDKEDQILTSVKGIEKQLTILNGRVGRSEEDVNSLKKRITIMERDDYTREGFEKGKKAMKASTKTIIGVIITGLTCLFIGINAFKSSERNLIKAVEAKTQNRFTKSQGRIIENRVKKLEEIIPGDVYQNTEVLLDEIRDIKKRLNKIH